MNKYDVAVLGGGPGGYVAAIRCAQYGKKTVLIEKAQVGGTCLNRGCIPTKALLHSAEVYHTVKTAAEYGVNVSGIGFDYPKIAAKKDSVVGKLRGGIEFLVKKAGAQIIAGEGKLKDSHTIIINGEEIWAENIILATGSAPVMPPIPGIESAGVMSSDGILSLTECPKSVIVVGGGVIGIEFATLFNTLGIKVTVVEMLPSILATLDEEIAISMDRSLKKKGIGIITGAKVLKLSNNGEVQCEYDKNGAVAVASGEICLIAAGRRPQTKGAGIEEAGVKLEKGFVLVDDAMRTNVPHIYAVGDITGKVQLAHVASAQGLTAAAAIAGKHAKMRYDIIPSCVYTSPEIAAVGLTEKQAANTGYTVKTGRFPVSANGKSMVMGEAEGFVKLITDAKTGEILGAHMMAPRATDMIAELCAVMRSEGTVEEVAETIHPHPTVSEMIMEAAHDVEGLCCHAISKK